jgi:hypothetical protein
MLATASRFATFSVLVLSASFAIAGCSLTPTSTTTGPSRPDLDKTLSRYGLPAVPCDVTNSRYTVSNNGAEYVGVTFSAPARCTQAFIDSLEKGNLIRRSPVGWPNDDTFADSSSDSSTTYTVGFLPIAPNIVSQFGWNLDHAKLYDMYVSTDQPDDSPAVTLLVNHSARADTIYVCSIK